MSTPVEIFLKRNSIGDIEGGLPYVHSTKSLNLRELIARSGLDPKKCEVYNEELLYFFLGRPAYRWIKPDGTPQDWELPTCFVFNDLPTTSIVRTVPFDSGAHATGRYPSYVQNVPLQNFEANFSGADRRIVSAFFGSFQNYLRGEARARVELENEFALSPLDAEILSISQLANDVSASGIDDRRFSVEVQCSEPVNFSEYSPDAIILPTAYLKDERVRKKIDEWDCEIIPYHTYGLNLSSCFAQIFMKFVEYCGHE